MSTSFYTQFYSVVQTESTVMTVLTLFGILLLLLGVAASIILFRRSRALRLLQRAQEAIARHQPVVIGITGSYGKSATVELLSHILESKVPHLVAAGTRHSILQTITRELAPEHRVLIVEMRAHLPGDVELLSALTQPIIGVVTALSDRHLSRFGHRNRTKEGMAELLRTLPSSGLAILNHDNEDVRHMAAETHAPVRFFSTRNVAHAAAAHIRARPHDVQCSLYLHKQSIPFSAPLYGKHMVQPLLAATLTAQSVGIDTSAILERLQQLPQLRSAFSFVHGKNHAVIIIDPHEPHPEGFKAALDYLHTFDGKRKIVITGGMNDLGERSREYHIRLGQYIASIADQLVITDRWYARHLKQGALAGGMKKEQILVSTSARRIISRCFSSLTPHDVVLVEGPIPRRLLDYVTEK